MEAGRLRHRVTLKQVTETQDSFGGVIRTWAEVATVWAAVEPLSGREYLLAGQQETAEVQTRIRIRYRSGVVPTMRVTWGSHWYEIVDVITDPIGRREITLMCREVV